MIRHLGMATATVLVLIATARGGYQFEFANGSGGLQTAFTGAAGDAIDVEVFLAQSGTDTGLTDFGLFGAAVRVTITSSAAHAANLLSASDISPNTTDFSADTSISNGKLDGLNKIGAANFINSGFIYEAIDLIPPGTAPTGSQIYLGTFAFHIPTSALAGDVTNLVTSIVDPTIPSQDNILDDFSGTSIDSLIANDSATITVLGSSGPVVPEPTTLTLMGLGLLGLAARGHRRNRRRT